MSKQKAKHSKPASLLRYDGLSSAELFGRALRSRSEGRRTQYVAALHFRPSQQVLRLAVDLCASANPRRRILGVDVLAQLGPGQYPLRSRTVPVLLGLLESEKDPEVLEAVAIAFSHTKSSRSVAGLSRLAQSPTVALRRAAVTGLLTHNTPLAIGTLIALTHDSDDHVRDWATFGLGSMIDSDDRKIRKALRLRLTDPNVDVRCEALVGLARRKDHTVLRSIQRAIREPQPYTLAFEAAYELGDHRLVPDLEDALKRFPNDNTDIALAIERCSSKKKPRAVRSKS
jgi:HEAT repeat protein